MELLPIEKFGAHQKAGKKIQFGFPLPWVSSADGNRLHIKIIHEKDQFKQNIAPRSFELTCEFLENVGEFWTGEIDISEVDAVADSAWGTPGKYNYRYELASPLLKEKLDWIVDPFAREFGIGRQSAFTLDYQDFVWEDIEMNWKTPKLKDLIIYEIMIHEFSFDLEGATKMLPYLQDLGVNCIEIMPVANVERSIDWGFEPIGPFGLDERFGSRKNFQKFIQAAHTHGLAVVLDMVYGHTGIHFAYEYIYSNLRYSENPFMGSYAQNMFGPSTDFNKQFTQDFYFTANYYWLDKYHIDGVRYDCVPNYYDGPMDAGYSNLVFNTYKTVKKTNGNGYWQRFFNGGELNLIQCAEQLENPVDIVRNTYSNCTWQNATIEAAKSVSTGNFGNIYSLGMSLGLWGYPENENFNNDFIEKTALQYIENHDHPRFIIHFGTKSIYRDILREGDRGNWFKLQPYAIGLLLSRGIPMLWQGQEIVENYDVPDSGFARIGILRPVRWEKFYSHEGKAMIALYRKLIAIRNREDIFRDGHYYFHNDWDNHQSRGILIFERRLGNAMAMVALNFSSVEQNIKYRFADGGDYQELLHDGHDLTIEANNQNLDITIPSNYGRVWLKAE
jgi:1,4-alpha-glucan branching enzyme